MLGYMCHNCAKFLIFLTSHKHFYKSKLYLSPYFYYFENKYCVTVILSCFSNLFLFLFLKVVTIFLKYML